MDGEEKECICLGIAGRVLENPGAVTKDRWKGDLVSAQAEASSECVYTVRTIQTFFPGFPISNPAQGQAWSQGLL